MFFITPNLLKYARGWCQIEFAFSDILNSNFNFRGGILLNYVLPLFFLDKESRANLNGTIWSIYQNNGPYFDEAKGLDQTQWSVKEIRSFLFYQQELAEQLAGVYKPQSVHGKLIKSQADGLFRRITNFEPRPLDPSN